MPSLDRSGCAICGVLCRGLSDEDLERLQASGVGTEFEVSHMALELRAARHFYAETHGVLAALERRLSARAHQPGPTGGIRRLMSPITLNMPPDGEGTPE